MNNVKEIHEIQKQINSPNILPEKAFRRDVNIYELVCYANLVTGCFISENYRPIPIIIERARLFMSEIKDDKFQEYYSILDRYFDLVAQEIKRGS